MFHITGCVVQADVAKAKKVAEQKQKALGQAQKDEQTEKDVDDSEDDSEDDIEDDDEPMSEVAKKKKEAREARDDREARQERVMEQANQKLRDEKARQALLVEAARNSEKSSVKPRARSSRRGILHPPRNQQKKGSAKKGAAEKGPTTEPVQTSKRKQPPDSEKSSTEPVVKRTKRASSPGDL